MKDRLERFVKLWIDLFAKHELLDHASAIAFQVLKASIPLTLLGLALLGATGEETVWNGTIAPAIQPHLQQPTFHAIDSAVQRIFATDSTGLIVFASLLVLWYVSGSVKAVMGSINQIYETDETRPWTVRYAISLGLAFCIAAGLIGSVLIVTVGGALAGGGAVGVLIDIARWLAAVVVLWLTLGVLVRFAPAERRAKRWASAGAALVIATWIVATLLFELFVSHVANFKTATGSLTVFLVVIGYVYTSSIILLVGVELDELLREDATAGQRGVLQLLFGVGK
ncbi:MAG: YihY/virulence factor BrkB family protein [Gaiellaceae bacterium]